MWLYELSVFNNTQGKIKVETFTSDAKDTAKTGVDKALDLLV